MGDQLWYYAEGGKPIGPMALTELTAVLSRVANAIDIPVWRNGFGQWQRAGEVRELRAYVIKPPPLSPLPLHSSSPTNWELSTVASAVKKKGVIGTRPFAIEEAYP
jgi:hypothetical protein